ncbi:MAG: peptide chain release factor N(5)-glutamine methyltransferase [Sulfurovum sp.]|nr:peptide chain release factor N(5)-glutamine methyltransferase [Sulfurovum sp.]
MKIYCQTMTVYNALKWAAVQLQVSCKRPQFEAELLLAYHLKKERIWLMTHPDTAVKNLNFFTSLVARRAMHEPYEYIVGEASFYDIHLAVEKGVLIPRPETETLIDITTEIIKREKITRIAEIGVGSGAISIVLARKFPQLYIVATDIEEKPLQVTAKNIVKYGVEAQITLQKSNLIDKVDKNIEMVVSNPPYIAENASLESNVIDHEPHSALFGGKIGDELLKQIITDVNKRGIRWLVCEMGYDQKRSIEVFVNKIEIQSINFYKDLSGHDRGFVVDFGVSNI